MCGTRSVLYTAQHKNNITHRQHNEPHKHSPCAEMTRLRNGAG
jgi:hypothetical protein